MLATLTAARGLQGEVEVRHKQDTPHARELRIMWSDGASWRLRLDEGFDFVRAVQKVAFSFSNPEGEQGVALASATLEVEARTSTHLYLIDVGH